MSRLTITTEPRYVDTAGARLCTQAFGHPGDPAIVLIHGACASMLWWPEPFCRMLAGHRRFVIRFDNRDTGLSTMSPPGAPDYALTDLAADVVAILDAYGLERAHIVGRSMMGAIALVLAVDHPERVQTLTFVTTTSGDDDLPPMTDDFLQAVPSPPDFTSREAVIEHIVEVMRAYAGRSPLFDEAAMRALAAADVDRTGNMASTLTNHFSIDFDGPRNGSFDQVGVPSLVIHGVLDPVYPRAHGPALAQHLGAKLLELPVTGHDVPPEHWQLVCSRLAHHTSTAPEG